jgi:hypothetical protein
MGIKRYKADADNTITNAFKANLTKRGTASNMGASDILEVFSIYAQASSSSGLSNEKTRTLIKFPISDITTDRTNNVIPASGSVNFYLRLYNAKHGQTVPKAFTLVAQAVSQSWTEGTGLDMENYSDLEASNWTNRIASRSAGDHAWDTEGGDYHTTPVFTQTFDTGIEDLEINVTTLVEQWLADTKTNYGFGVFLTSSEEDSTTRSYYTKKFFARTSEFFFKRPSLEARFNAARHDNRADFYYSSSLAPAADNLNTIYLYNRIRGRLINIPSIDTGNIYVSIYSGSTAPTGSALTLVADGTHVAAGSPTFVTGGHVSTGIYSASFALTAASTPLTKLFDVWLSGSTQYSTGSITPQIFSTNDNAYNQRHLNKIINLKPKYFTDETAQLRVYSRLRDWSPNIYTVAKSVPQTSIVVSSSYAIHRIIDDLLVIPFGTGSDLHTLASYDISGNYFDLDMSMLEPDYAYALQLAHYNEYVSDWEIQPELFRFRVEKRQTE